jgi:hypothetical protein
VTAKRLRKSKKRKMQKELMTVTEKSSLIELKASILGAWLLLLDVDPEPVLLDIKTAEEARQLLVATVALGAAKEQQGVGRDDMAKILNNVKVQGENNDGKDTSDRGTDPEMAEQN